MKTIKYPDRASWTKIVYINKNDVIEGVFEGNAIFAAKMQSQNIFYGPAVVLLEQYAEMDQCQRIRKDKPGIYCMHCEATEIVNKAQAAEENGT